MSVEVRRSCDVCNFTEVYRGTDDQADSLISHRRLQLTGGVDGDLSGSAEARPIPLLNGHICFECVEELQNAIKTTALKVLAERAGCNKPKPRDEEAAHQ